MVSFRYSSAFILMHAVSVLGLLLIALYPQLVNSTGTSGREQERGNLKKMMEFRITCRRNTKWTQKPLCTSISLPHTCVYTYTHEDRCTRTHTQLTTRDCFRATSDFEMPALSFLWFHIYMNIFLESLFCLIDKFINSSFKCQSYRLNFNIQCGKILLSDNLLYSLFKVILWSSHPVPPMHSKSCCDL